MTRLRPSRAALALFGATLVSACAGGPRTPPAPIVQPITNSAQLGDVIALLERGETKTARKVLKAMIHRNPGDISVQILQRSLDEDPTATLGAKSFRYTARDGDTMVTLSQRFLGTPLKFYLLSRYNDVAVPASLRTGQELRIPGQAPEAAPTPPAARAAQPRAVVKPKAAAAPAAAPKIDVARAARLRASGLVALNRGKANEAVTLLQQASDAAPGNALIMRDLARARRIQQSLGQAK